MRLLSHPLREQVLYEYLGPPACPSEVSRRLGAPLNLVSYHTRVLADSGWLRAVRTERHRGGIAHYYRATVEPFIDDGPWAALTPTLRRHLTLGILQRAAEEARRGALAGGFDAAEAHLTRFPFEVDAEGVAAVCAVLRRAFDELMQIVEDAASRPGPRGPYTVVMLAFADAAPGAR